MDHGSLSAAAQAFDALAESFDQRFGAWNSVAAQRRAVRAELLSAFPAGARVLEIGGGTGEDAEWLVRHGREVLLTDAAPAMVRLARARLGDERARVLAAEDLPALAAELTPDGEPAFDGVFSNFAALNCVADLAPVARGLARLVRPGSAVVLVLFGPLSPGEILVQLARRDPRAALRRLTRGPARARLAGRDFVVYYHRPRAIVDALRPWFHATGARGIGVLVPPSAAEPWISRHPRLLKALEAADRVVSKPLAYLGDHVLYRFRRTGLPVPEGRELEILGRADDTPGRPSSSRSPFPVPRSPDFRSPDFRSPVSRFRDAYGEHRASEGRRIGGDELLSLPYLASGPLARQWAVRARSFDAFMGRVLVPEAGRLARPLRVLDLGAGNGWLCYRAALAGNEALALDLRLDAVDGLGAAAGFLRERPGLFRRVAASFEALPVKSGSFDVAVFNAALHYALDLPAVLGEARRVVRPGGRVVILDSPFYARAADGAAMVAEKRRDAARDFGDRAGDLLALPFIEFLTPDRLGEASAGLGLAWRRHRVRYPLWYEARAMVAWLGRRRAPSRFDLWECTVP